MPLDNPTDSGPKRPNLFLVGAMKAGTTSVYASLETSPQVFAVENKEPHHFSTDLHRHPHTMMRRTLHSFPNARFIESRREYLALYEGAGPQSRYIVDASTSYLYSTQAAANIFAFAPDAKIAILLRDPVSRAWSEYKMNQFIGLETDPFREAIRREQRRLDRRGTLLYKRYLLAGLYADQVARYLRLFPREQVFLDVIDRPGEGFGPVVERLVRFLGLPEGSITALHENEAQAPFNSLINSALYYSGLKATISRLTPRGLKSLAKGSYYAPIQSRIPPAERDFIAPFFEDSNQRLADLTGLDLRHWTSAKAARPRRSVAVEPAAPTSEKGPARTAEPVVIYRLGSLGDTVVSVPCFHQIARSFPDAPRVLLTNFPISPVAAPAEMILRNGGFIDRSIYYHIRERRLVKLVELWRALRQVDSRTLIYLTEGRSWLANWRDLVFFRLCGFRRILGAPLTLAGSRVRRDPATGVVEREAERLARVLAEFGPIDLNDPANWDLRLTHEERRIADLFLQPLAGRSFIAINTGGKVKINDWGLPNWEALLSRLGERMPDVGLVVVGAAEDDARAQHLAGFWPGPVLSACGRLSPRESAAVLKRARLFVGHDSGPLHLSAAVGIPCVSMFGQNNPPCKWHPIGARHRIIHDLRGVLAISVDQILEATLDALGSGHAWPSQSQAI